MKTCCLVWEIPVIEGEHYNPIMNVIYMQKAKKFLNQLNRYFQDENMDWKCVLDHSACTYNEIFSSEHQAVIFAPEAKTRQWLYKKDFQKKIKISDNTTRDLTKGCDCMKKKSISVICAVLVISGVATVLVLTGNRGNVSNVKRVVGYSALYGENSIKEAFDVIEKKFAKDFEGCTLTELRYDEDVENRFAEEIEKYHKENNQ